MTTNTGQKHILVTDDSLTVRMEISELLEKRGFRVFLAEDGRQCLDILKKERPDLILLDIKMIDLSGFEVCRQLKTDEQNKDIPVIFISALNDLADKVQGFAAGGVDYITKPFQPEEVLARVETHLTLHDIRKKLEAQNILFHQEITERMRVEEVLREVEERFRLAAHVASDLLYEWDINDGTLLWFGDIDKALGYAREELPRTIEAWVNLIHPEDVARLSDAVEYQKKSTEPIQYEYRNKRKDG